MLAAPATLLVLAILDARKEDQKNQHNQTQKLNTRKDQ
jgi:hypothetical protein